MEKVHAQSQTSINLSEEVKLSKQVSLPDLPSAAPVASKGRFNVKVVKGTPALPSNSPQETVSSSLSPLALKAPVQIVEAITSPRDDVIANFDLNDISSESGGAMLDVTSAITDRGGAESTFNVTANMVDTSNSYLNNKNNNQMINNTHSAEYTQLSVQIDSSTQDDAVTVSPLSNASSEFFPDNQISTTGPPPPLLPTDTQITISGNDMVATWTAKHPPSFHDAIEPLLSVSDVLPSQPQQLEEIGVVFGQQASAVAALPPVAGYTMAAESVPPDLGVLCDLPPPSTGQTVSSLHSSSNSSTTSNNVPFPIPDNMNIAATTAVITQPITNPILSETATTNPDIQGAMSASATVATTALASSTNSAGNTAVVSPLSILPGASSNGSNGVDASAAVSAPVSVGKVPLSSSITAPVVTTNSQLLEFDPFVPAVSTALLAEGDSFTLSYSNC